MAKPYSDDLRERAVAAIESGHTREEVAELYNLALSTVGGFIRRKRETGSVSPWRPQDICACTAHRSGQEARSGNSRIARITSLNCGPIGKQAFDEAERRSERYTGERPRRKVVS